MHKCQKNKCCSCSLLQWKSLFAFSSLVIFGKKARSGHITTFDFYFHQEHSKAHLHSCRIHTGGSLSLTLSFSLSISLFPFLFLYMLFFFVYHFFERPFMSFHYEGRQRGCWWLLSPASLLRFCCSCWAVIKKVKKSSFHTNYDTIMNCLVKGTVKMKVKLSLIKSE